MGCRFSVRLFFGDRDSERLSEMQWKPNRFPWADEPTINTVARATEMCTTVPLDSVSTQFSTLRNSETTCLR